MDLAACAWHDNLGRVSDEELVSEYQRAKYVLALRKYEALRCGARPILYDLPSFRWYKGHAVFLNASIRGDELSDAIVEALQKPAEPVTADELTTLHATFCGRRLCPLCLIGSPIASMEVCDCEHKINAFCFRHLCICCVSCTNILLLSEHATRSQRQVALRYPREHRFC